MDLWWNIGYLQGPPRDGAYGYVPLNIPPRAPSRTPRLNNIQIYIEIYCYSTTDTKGQCFWRCPAYIAVTFHLVSEAEKQDIKGKEKKSICSIFSRTHPNVLVYCDFHNYKSILISLYTNISIVQNDEKYNTNINSLNPNDPNDLYFLLFGYFLMAQLWWKSSNLLIESCVYTNDDNFSVFLLLYFNFDNGLI